MSGPLTPKERKLKRRLRRHEAMLKAGLDESPRIVVDGKVGIFVPVLDAPEQRGVKLVRL
jgi:hypothetical protein